MQEAVQGGVHVQVSSSCRGVPSDLQCFRCTNQKMCVSPGKYYDAFYQIEIMGVVWIQPKIIEYRGKIIVLSPSAPHNSQLELLTFTDKESRRWERKRRKKAR